MLVTNSMNNDIRNELDKLSTQERSKTIKAVAFDMDGLMLNTEDLYEQVGHLLMRRRGKKYSDEVRNRMIGLPAPQAYGVLIEEEGMSETWQELQQETDEIFEKILPTQLATMRGLIELLDHLDELGMRRCVATSSSRSFARKALTIVGLLERVDFVITAEDVFKGKPNPDIYLAAAKKLSVDVENMLVLEDSPTGTKAGVSAGAYVVSVPNEHTKQGCFEGCRWIANSLLDERIYGLLKA
ncbi:MAG TPA: HAD family phosphatase [Pirellula sp.]|nr:HAD family phosphatase [Pirellula sp.]